MDGSPSAVRSCALRSRRCFGTSAIHSVTTHVRIEFRAFFLVSCNFQGVSLYKFLRRLSQGVLELTFGALLCFFLDIFEYSF